MQVQERTTKVLQDVAVVAKNLTSFTVQNGRYVHSTRTGLLMGLLAKTAALPNGTYTVALALPTPDGGIRTWVKRNDE